MFGVCSALEGMWCIHVRSSTLAWLSRDESLEFDNLAGLIKMWRGLDAERVEVSVIKIIIIMISASSAAPQFPYWGDEGICNNGILGCQSWRAASELYLSWCCILCEGSHLAKRASVFSSGGGGMCSLFCAALRALPLTVQAPCLLE